MAVDPHNSTPTPANSKRLESWKEIASHIGRDERTAMRWEALGMPVHRAPGERRGRVYAFTHEIDAWIAAHDSSLHNTAQLEDAWNGPKESKPRSQSAANGTTTPAPNDAPSAGQPTTEAPSSQQEAISPSDNSGSKRTRILLTALVLLAAVTSTYFWFRPGAPVRYSVQGTELSTFDANGRLVWKHQFPYGVSRLPSVPPQYAARFVDLDSDGDEEFLFAVSPDPPLETGYLICFDRRARERWRRELTETLRFGGGPQGPPHVPQNFIITYPHPGAPPHIWLYSHHRTWMASEVAKLDANGKSLGSFWNAGHINVLREATLHGRKVILLAGTHNESFGAFLAALDYDALKGCSPADTEKFRCKNYPVDGFLHYVLFPQTEIGRLLSSRSYGAQIDLRPDGYIELKVNDGEVESEQAGVNYTLNEDFELMEAEVTESYRAAHNALQSKAMLDHALDRRKEAAALRMRRWLGDRFSDPVAPKNLAQTKSKK